MVSSPAIRNRPETNAGKERPSGRACSRPNAQVRHPQAAQARDPSVREIGALLGEPSRGRAGLSRD